MLSYWLDGNSQTMLAIHDIAGRVAAGIPIDAEQPFEERRYMSMSLPTWQQLTQDSDIDFVVSDGDDEDGGEASYGTEESCEDPTQLLRMLSEKKRRRMVGNRDREYSSSGPDHCEDALSDDEIVYDSEPDALDLAKNPRLRQTKRSEKGQVKPSRLGRSPVNAEMRPRAPHLPPAGWQAEAQG